jgi:N-acetylmuramoyl-L-alanine amidase
MMRGIWKMSKRTDLFFETIKTGCMQLWEKFGILPSVAAGQAALESAWGSSTLAIKYHNLFGIKGSYDGNSAMLNTWEVYGGKRYDIKAGFRSYPDWETSILDYGVFLTKNKRYGKAIGIKSHRVQIEAIHQAGYATDPQYSDKVISIIEKYRLQEWDRVVLDLSPTTPPPNQKHVNYKVRTGDTLSHIAKKYQTTVSYLETLNNIDNPNLIYSGQVLLVPDTAKKYHTVVYGDTLSEIAEHYKTTVTKLVGLNRIHDRNLIKVGQRLRVK